MIKHLIVFNTEPGVPEEDCLAMARQARETLIHIPGVRDVTFGVAAAERVAYRYLLIVELEWESVIAFYRDHPIHVQFANQVFRPMAVDRITTDFRMLL